MIRASVTNRVGNGVPGAAVAIHGRRRSERSRAVLRTVAYRGANSRSASAHRRPIDQGAAVHRAGCGTATCSRRDGAVSKSGCRRAERRRPRFATAVRPSWLLTRFWAGVRRTAGDGVIASTDAGDPIFHADEPEPSRRFSAAPARPTGAASSTCSRRMARTASGRSCSGRQRERPSSWEESAQRFLPATRP